MSTLWKAGCSPFKDKAGRNNQGKITVRRRGAGVKKHFRNISWDVQNPEQYKIEAFEYDPHRNAKVAFIKNENEQKFFVIATEKMKVGQSYDGFKPLKDFPLGAEVSNVDMKFVRAGGTAAVILTKGEEGVLIRLPSGETRLIDGNAKATDGRLTLNEKVGKRIKNAGTNRRLGVRPHVRGVAMNPVDHPHGGGEGKASGGRPSVTPWGIITKGKPTRLKPWPTCVITPRKRAYQKKN
jgi:large subunit ribosomal protein L2